MENSEMLTDALACREGVYSLLWRCFAKEPDVALVGVLADDATAALVRLYFGEGPFSRFVSGVQEPLRAALAEGADEPVARDLANAYVRLFVGPGRPLAAPWESLYVGDADQLFTDTTLSVRAAYRAAGFRNAGYPAEPDDHIATELSFMRALSERARRQAEAGDAEACGLSLEASRTFGREHLANWAAKFARRLSACAKPGPYGIYAAVGELLEEAVESEDRVLGELLDAVRAL